MEGSDQSFERSDELANLMLLSSQIKGEEITANPKYKTL